MRILKILRASIILHHLWYLITTLGKYKAFQSNTVEIATVYDINYSCWAKDHVLSMRMAEEVTALLPVFTSIVLLYWLASVPLLISSGIGMTYWLYRERSIELDTIANRNTTITLLLKRVEAIGKIQSIASIRDRGVTIGCEIIYTLPIGGTKTLSECVPHPVTILSVIRSKFIPYRISATTK